MQGIDEWSSYQHWKLNKKGVYFFLSYHIVFQEDVTAVDIYTSNRMVLRHIKRELWGIQGAKHKTPVLGLCYTTHLIENVRANGQKIIKDIETVNKNNTILPLRRKRKNSAPNQKRKHIISNTRWIFIWSKVN